MIKNLKLFFFFLLLPFLVVPSLFFLSPPSQSVFASSPRTYSADNWTPKQKQATLSALESNRANWLTDVALGLKKLEFKSGVKDVVFHFDKLAAAFQTQTFKQKVLPTVSNSGFDFTKIQGEAQKQLLQPYKKGTINHVDGFQFAIISTRNKYADLFLNSIRPSILKMQVLGLSKVDVSYKPQYDISYLTNKKNFKNTLYRELSDYGVKIELQTFALFTFSPVPNFAKIVLDRTINKVWGSWLQVLQKASSLDLTHITVNGKRFDISSLVVSKVQEVSALSLADLKILKKLEPLGLSKLQTQVQVWIDTQIQIISAFQKNWDGGKVSSYLLWLPVFDIKEVKLNQNEVLPVDAFATAIKTMLVAERFDFTKLKGEARKQLLNLLNTQGNIKAEKTFQDDVWKQIKNHQKWKTIEGPLGQLTLQRIKTLLLEVQDLGISKVSHSFFPEGYDLSFLKNDESWKEISFQDLLQGMKVAVNEVNVRFYSHLFPNKIVFQVPMKKLTTVFSEITITNIIKALERAISGHPQQEKKLKTKNKGLIIGLSVAGGILFLSALGGSLYWFFKIKK